ncbi:adenosylcobinamide-GDP ribazoletransferase [Pseudobutyrivibrio sp. MD2005]|uniref:adenosylcobinamide-GDP ribazoletransferase n=1 Tax=Pseudobutyrivibrio sp. MD2005 TaxID=1410616 RepID=UPI0004885A49|nr:adenosylcobinamide-GDP ribazoletransferase [Pseudobutyrivibrio sp. MD2005]
MRIIKSIIVAFSMYSRIPMPRFTWGSEDMKYHFIFFPWVGAVIGLIEYGWRLLCEYFTVPHIVFTLIAIAIPLIVTGGFHVDGFMDTVDALSSYQDKEKRLEILKDPHIGAFAVIGLVVYGLFMTSAIYLMDHSGFIAWSIIFFESRAVSGICAINYKKAKNSGSLHVESNTASEKVVVTSLAIQFVIVSIVAGHYLQLYWNVALVPLVIVLIYYYFMSRDKFGGVTGDLAGWFVCSAELWSGLAVGVFSFINGIRI